MSDDDKDLLFYNPTNYVVDVIGEGRAATLGASTMSTTAHWPVPTTPVQPRALHPDVPQTPVQPRALKDDITKTPVQPVMVNTPLTQNPVQPHATNMPLTQTPVQPRQMPVATSTPLNGIASTNNEGTDDVVNDLGMGTSDSEGTDDIDGLGARANPWRQLTAAEVTELGSSSVCAAALSSPATHHQITNGVPEKIFTCHGFTLMQQRASSGTYYFVYGHPGLIKIPTGQKQADARYRASLHGVPMTNVSCAHWPSLAGVKRGVGDAATDQQNADAVAMNNSLADHGYKQADQYLYKAFQTDVGLKPDGFPGAKTMQELKDVLFALGIEIANVPVYPWLSTGGYDGVNAPLWSDWAPGQPAPGGATLPAPPLPPPPSGGTTTVTTTTVTGDAAKKKSSAGVIIVGATAAAVAGGLGYMYYRKRRARR